MISHFIDLLDAMNTEIERLKRQVDELDNKLATANARKKPGRPPKPDTADEGMYNDEE